MTGTDEARRLLEKVQAVLVDMDTRLTWSGDLAFRTRIKDALRAVGGRLAANPESKPDAWVTEALAMLRRCAQAADGYGPNYAILNAADVLERALASSSPGRC